MKKEIAKITKVNGSFVASIKKGEKFDLHFVSKKSIRGSIGTVVYVTSGILDRNTDTELPLGDYQIQGYEDDYILISTFEDKTKLFKVLRKEIKHKLDYLKENRFYLGELIEKPTVKGTQFYFVVIKELKSKKNGTKLESKSIQVSEIQS
jgi:hypothetical protein